MIRTELKIDGMMCGMCESHMNDVVRKTCRVKKVTSSHSKGITEILSDEKLDIPALQKAVSEIGYKILDVSVSEVENKKGFFARLVKKA